MATFVIVHGAYAGGWYFQATARVIRAVGHEVYTPTLTGIGERVHLAHPAINLDTHVQDIVNVLEYEDLHDVILVGYSYGGMVTTVVANQMSERIAQLIYLDAFVPLSGQSIKDLLPDSAPQMEEAARLHGDGWRIPHNPPHPRKTPQPIETSRQPAILHDTTAAPLPSTYILLTQNSLNFAPTLAKMAARAQSLGWRYRELSADHIAPETHPQEIANLLVELA